ncbi:cytosolic arginine sensor for mTORC1 subunit 1 isoform X3 [Delphinus delphis]|uniref:cytosolic arginine sensor for mTORC1 subunit 1 isoform X3 n=1 Tax=Delphinus delphis TaxID=9728 RepID=UPI0028C492C3|nr:cytosolic arginine sensor for mTORC1 subunit 1 isoform X3 [Delphinus delphis]
MELHILEHRVRVLSLARPGLWLYTHPLIKLLFLPRRSRWGHSFLATAGSFLQMPPIGSEGLVLGAQGPTLRDCRRGCKFFSLTETPEDYTLMVDEEGFKELPPSEFLQVAEATWLVLNVSSHSGAAVQAAGVTKIARSVIAPLAEHHVSVLMLSTYQTDFILGPAPRSIPSRAQRTVSVSSRWTLRRCQPSPPPSLMSSSIHTVPLRRQPPVVLDPAPSPSLLSPSLRATSPLSWMLKRRKNECGIVAQIAGPLAAADISAYYISTFNFDHALVPEDGIGSVIKVLQHRQEGLGS